MDVKGSVVFVTGANRGLGLAFAREALARGAAKVYAGMRNIEKFDEPGLIPVRIDVTDPHSIAAAAAQCADVTVLINNAGIAALVANPLDEALDAQSQRLFETNYYGVVRVTRAFAPHLIRNHPSAIVNVLSDVTWLPKPILTPYVISKAAAWSFTNNVRLHLAGQNVQVLGLHVGYVDTDLAKGVNAPKSSPVDVVRQTLDALQVGKSEVMADEGTLALKKSLSEEIPGYINPA